MLTINARRPFEDDKPDGLLESDNDFVLNNFDACVTILERLPEILEADDISAQDRIEAIYALFGM